MTGHIIELKEQAEAAAVAEPEESSSRTEKVFSGRNVLWLAILSLFSFALRYDFQLQHFWVDEALSIGIASYPLDEIPSLLRLDGSPPLFYLLLHLWMEAFGQSEQATHSLSMIWALLCIPVAFWGGTTLFGRRAGWITAILTATNAYLALYSGETRMYTMVVFFSMIATITFLHVFAYRHRKYLPAFVISLTLLLYTHNWGLFFALGAGVALLPCFWRAEDRKRLVLDAVIGFGVTAIAYAPWVPTLLYQSETTAAPWSTKPILRELVSALGFILGDERVIVALVLAGGGSIIGLFLQPRLREGSAVWAAGVLLGVILLSGWLVSQGNPAWAGRYFGVFLPVVLLIAALGLSRGKTQGLIALGLILLFWVQPLGRLTGSRATGPNRKSIAHPVANKVTPLLNEGDTVIAIQMEELPLLRYYLPKDLKYATALGPEDNPEIVDWRHAEERMEASNVEEGLKPMVESAEVGEQFLLICYRYVPDSDARRWFHIMHRRCGEWKSAFAEDGRFEEVTIPNLTTGRQMQEADRFVKLYKKVSD